MKIGLITGGNGPERDISLLSTKSTQEGLIQLGHSVTTYDIPHDLENLTHDLGQQAQEFYFVMIHGEGGEDGQIAQLLDIYEAKYQTTTPDILALTMNKAWTKAVREKAGLPVAQDIIRSPQKKSAQDIYTKIVTDIGTQCVIKETSLGSSKGVYICKNEDDIINVLDIYKKHTQHILIEELLVGDEITVGLLDTKDATKVLPSILIIPPENGEFDYENKYNGKTQEICPAPLDKTILQQAEQIAYSAYHAVGCTSYGRIDMMLTKKGPVLIEINTIPGFTNQSLFPLAAKTAGISFNELLQHLIDVNYTICNTKVISS